LPRRSRHAAEAREHSSTQEEIAAMLESEFGKPEVVGKEISNAKGRVRTYLEKWKRVLPVSVAVLLVLNFSIRWAVAEPFYVPGAATEPSIPHGSRVLVYKLASAFRAGDVVAFRNPEGEILLAIVKTDQGGVLTVSRNDEADREVPHARVIGRVVANTR
jgi:signal peptidase I